MLLFIAQCEDYLIPQRGVDGEDHIHVGKLNLVDLAGSERQSKTGATVRAHLTL